MGSRTTARASGHRRARRIRSAVLGALALAPLAACPEAPRFTGSSLMLTDLADGARLEGAIPRRMPDELRVEWVRGGVALVSMPVRPSDAKRISTSGLEVLRWELPLPLSPDWSDPEAAPRLEGVTLPRYVPRPDLETPIAFEDRPAWRVLERQLLLARPPGQALAEDLRLAWPVWAVHLVGTGLLAGTPLEEVLRVRYLHGEGYARSEESLAVLGGSSVSVPLPLTDPGRLLASFSAEGAPGAGPVRFRMALDEEVLYEGELTPGGEEVQLELPFHVRAFEARLHLAADGAPSSTVFVRAPLYVRPRDTTDPPSLVLIVVDPLRSDRLGLLGNRNELTPVLDRFARDSLVFAQCWATSSWTLPSLASLVTSTYPSQHGADLETRRLGRGIDTLAELLRGQGYHTAAFTGGGFAAPRFGLDRGFATFDARGGGIDALVDRVLEWELRFGDAPRFLLVHTNHPQAPYGVKREPPDPGDYDRPPPKLPKWAYYEPTPTAFYDDMRAQPELIKPIGRGLAERYDEEVREVDAKLGELLDHFRSTGELDGMLIAITSSHGEEFAEHRWLSHGDALYVEDVAVPVILHLPEGRRADEIQYKPLSAVDVAPMLLENLRLADLLEESTFVGHSVMRGAAPSPVLAMRNAVRSGPLYALRVGTNVWIEGDYLHKRGPTELGELYDVSVDFDQKRNLVTENKPRAMKLRSLLAQVRKRFGELLTVGQGTPPEATVRARQQGYGFAGGD